MNRIFKSDKITKEVEDRRSRVIFETYIIYIISFSISLFINGQFSYSSDDFYSPMFREFLIVLALLTVAIFVIHFFIKNYRTKCALYFIMALVVTQSFYTLTQHLHILSTVLTVMLMFVIMLATFNPYYILAYGLLSILSFYMSTYALGTTDVTLGNNYAYNVMITAGVITLSYLRIIQLYLWYNDQLTKTLENAQTANTELSALNEEFAATEEELLHQYDEIKTLNQKTNQLFDQQNAILEASEDGVIEFNINTRAISMSPKTEKLLGENSGTLTVELLKNHLSVNDHKAFMNVFDSVINKEHRKNTIEVTYNHGDIVLDVRLTFLYYQPKNHHDEFVIIVIKDITLEKEQAKDIYKMAYYDKLTGLYNRSGFLAHIKEHFIDHKENYHLLLLDIDNFKYYNDTFGYIVGDALIKDVGNNLQTLIGAKGELGRVGSDDFAIAFKTEINLQEFIDALNNSRHRFVYEDTEFFINYSIGITTSTSNQAIEDVLKHAELAMYKVKERGKNNYAFFEKDYSEEMQKRLMLTNALEKGLKNNEIYMNYQPIYNHETGKIHGFESLVRWNSHDHGFVSPGIFIPLAEKTGFINELGKHILDLSCKFANKLYELDKTLYVSMNVSSKQLLNPTFYNEFSNIIKANGTNPNQIAIEITESALIDNYDLAIDSLNKIKEKGAKIYLDDFGTGYSSLNYLNQLPIDVIKIDKSFIDYLETNDRDRIMVSNIVHMASSFNLETVAEGVEEKEQSAILADLGCNLLQGYYFDRPLAEEDALSRIQ